MHTPRTRIENGPLLFDTQDWDSLTLPVSENGSRASRTSFLQKMTQLQAEVVRHRLGTTAHPVASSSRATRCQSPAALRGSDRTRRR